MPRNGRNEGRVESVGATPLDRGRQSITDD